MLPDDVWYHYYDLPCEVCEEQIHWREETHVNCEACSTLMCEDCHQECVDQCHVCAEKLEDDSACDFPHTCKDCLKTCTDCDVSFHPVCESEHRKLCSPIGRAKRAVRSAKKLVHDTKQGIRKTKRSLQDREKALVDAEIAQANAEKHLRMLRKRK